MDFFVLDCSMTMAWCFEDEATTKTDALFESLDDLHALAPAIWPLEVGNVLAIAERRKRITRTKAQEILKTIQDLAIQVDHHPLPDYGLDAIMPLAWEHELTSYDAAYLELALRENIPLATLDASLKKVAKKISVPVL